MRLLPLINRRRPILYWFRITSTPDGGAPQHIRDAWVGTTLPVRDPRLPEGPSPHVGFNMIRAAEFALADGVSINPKDALICLDFYGRVDAFNWWSDWLRHMGRTRLLFRVSEGELLPKTLAPRLHPEIVELERLL